jgi:hypothetical protein
LMNDLDCIVDLGATTGAVAAQICENPRAAVSRSEAHTQYTLQHTHILDTSAGLVAQAVVCSVVMKVVLISASRHNTLKPCEKFHRVQCGSARSLNENIADLPCVVQR